MNVQEIIFVVEENLEGGYNAQALGHSVFVQGDTFQELKDNIRDALECHFDRKETVYSRMILGAAGG
jgi:hypothetical protein